MDFSWVKDKSTSFFSFIHGSKYDELRALPTTEQIRAARLPARPAAKQSPPRRSTISSAPDPPVRDMILVGANYLPQRTESPGRYIIVYSADRVQYETSDGRKEEKFPNLKEVLQTTIRTNDSPLWYESCEVPKGTDSVIAFTAWNVTEHPPGDVRIAESEYYTVERLLDISLGTSVAISLEVDGKGKHRSTSLFFIAEDISPRPRTPQPPAAQAVGPSGVGSSGAGSSGGGPNRRGSV
ncbi:hypothetical protein EV714DRAFT_212767 [Schizophyllum commune]